MTEKPNPRNDQEPFNKSTARIEQGTISEFKKFEDDDRYIVRVEPYEAAFDPAKFRKALIQFEQQSGLDVVKYRDVIAKSKYTGQDEVESKQIDENGFYPAVYRLVDRVNGVDLDTGVTEGSLPIAEITRLLDGLVTYGLYADSYKGSIVSEIRPSQFMYGTTAEDNVSKWYMVDLDYGLHSAGTWYTIECFYDCYEQIVKKYPAQPEFTNSIQRMIEYLRQPRVQEFIKTHTFGFVGDLLDDLRLYLENPQG